MASCKQNEWEHGGSTNRKVDFFFDKSTNSTNEKMNEQLLFSDFYHWRFRVHQLNLHLPKKKILVQSQYRIKGLICDSEW